MSRYRYKSKKKSFLTEIPIWVWCVAVLSIYFALWEGKVIEFATDDSPVNGADRSEDEDSLMVKSRM